MVIAHVRRDAVAEFQTFLQLNPAARAAAAFPPAAAETPSPVAKADKSCVETVLKLASNVSTLDDAQLRAGRKLLAYDGGSISARRLCRRPVDFAARWWDQRAGYLSSDHAWKELRDKRNWQTIPVGQHQAGDSGSTRGDQPDHGRDHIYVVLKKVDDDEMLIADNQQSQPHSRFVSGQGRTPTKFFLRAT